MCFAWFVPLTGLQDVRARFWRCHAIPSVHSGSRTCGSGPRARAAPSYPCAPLFARIHAHVHRYPIGFRSTVLVEGCRRPSPWGLKIWFQIIPRNGPVDLSWKSRCNYAWAGSFGREQINPLAVRSISCCRAAGVIFDRCFWTVKTRLESKKWPGEFIWIKYRFFVLVIVRSGVACFQRLAGYNFWKNSLEYFESCDTFGYSSVIFHRGEITDRYYSWMRLRI